MPKFTVSGPMGGTFEFEPDPATLMGDELILIHEHLGGGSLHDLGEKLTAMSIETLDVRQLLLMLYLGARRSGQTASFDEFVRNIAPFTLQMEKSDDAPAGGLDGLPRAEPQPATA